MTTYRTPSKPTTTKVADLINHDVAMRVVEHKTDIKTTNGNTNVVVVDAYTITRTGWEPRGQVWVFATFLREQLEGVDEGGWFAGRIVKPREAYFWNDLDDELGDVVERLIAATENPAF